MAEQSIWVLESLVMEEWGVQGTPRGHGRGWLGRLEQTLYSTSTPSRYMSGRSEQRCNKQREEAERQAQREEAERHERREEAERQERREEAERQAQREREEAER
ncbi:hypothetical protein E2C01_025795 [Portunus trituberculatus]|uniref:Uncharacterized protein n=1 Tax=Portunus trituberculatus TaxID=210409 RepID=A0A5B7EGH0_PORTR|nr:hypothetical protein [Portunus trituberculatus]